MKEFLTTMQPIVAKIIECLDCFLGGYDDLMITLAAFVVTDYIASIMCAIDDKNLSSEVGLKGICQKVMIFLLVGIANILDIHIIGTKSILRTIVISFYISNEGFSLMKKAEYIDLPIPQKVKAVLKQLHDIAEMEDK